MKILQIAHDYYNKSIYANLIDELNAIGVSSIVYASDNRHIATNENNVYTSTQTFSKIERFLFFPKQRCLLQDITKQIEFADIDLIHAHTLFSAGYIAMQLYKKYNIPYIAAIRNTDVNIFFRHMPHLRHIGREIAQHAKHIVFISESYKKQVLGTYLPQSIESKSVVIPNGIDNIFINNRSRHINDKNTIRLIYVGRLEKAKNVDTVIRVAEMLKKEGKQVSLCLIGKRMDDRYLKFDCRQDFITWYDESPSTHVLKMLRENDIFVMPSYHETFGLVYAEAMSQGLPVIYTCNQGFDGIFADGEVGFAVPPDNTRYIADKIIQITSDYDSISQRCVDRVEQFSWSNIAKQYYHLYSNTK